MKTETQTQVTKKFVSLVEKRPDLAKEWNYEKNGNLRISRRILVTLVMS